MVETLTSKCIQALPLEAILYIFITFRLNLELKYALLLSISNQLGLIILKDRFNQCFVESKITKKILEVKFTLKIEDYVFVLTQLAEDLQRELNNNFSDPSFPPCDYERFLISELISCSRKITYCANEFMTEENVGVLYGRFLTSEYYSNFKYLIINLKRELSPSFFKLSEKYGEWLMQFL